MGDGKRILFQVSRKSESWNESFFFFAGSRNEAAKKFREKVGCKSTTKLSIRKVKK